MAYINQSEHSIRQIWTNESAPLCLGAGQAPEHFSSVISLTVVSQSGLGHVTCLTEGTGKLGTPTHLLSQLLLG